MGIHFWEGYEACPTETNAMCRWRVRRHNSPGKLSNQTPVLVKMVWKFLKKLKIELPYDLAVTLLGMYPEKTIIWKDTCTPIFIAALFTIGKTWKQRNCPSADEWMKKMWYIYTMEYYSAIKKNEIMPFAATWMDLEVIILSEVRRTNTNIM